MGSPGVKWSIRNVMVMTPQASGIRISTLRAAYLNTTYSQLGICSLHEYRSNAGNGWKSPCDLYPGPILFATPLKDVVRASAPGSFTGNGGQGDVRGMLRVVVNGLIGNPHLRV